MSVRSKKQKSRVFFAVLGLWPYNALHRSSKSSRSGESNVFFSHVSCSLACHCLPWPFLVGFDPSWPSLAGLHWPSSVGLGLPWSASVIAAWPWLALASLAWPRPVLVFRGLLLPRPSSVLKQTRQCSRAEFFENGGSDFVEVQSKLCRRKVGLKLSRVPKGRKWPIGNQISENFRLAS